MKGLADKRKLRLLVIYLSLMAALAATLFLTPMIGSQGPIGLKYGSGISFEAVFDILTGNGGKWPATWQAIILEVRLPQILLAGLVGSALAISGTTMQCVFKNPMADPYIIGISAGAALGAAVSMTLQFSSRYMLAFMAFLGAMVTLFIVYNIARTKGKVRMETLLLSGIALGSFLTAITLFLMYYMDQGVSRMFFWMMGSFQNSSWEMIYIAFPVIVLASVGIFFFSNHLNAMLLGEEPAKHLGVDVEKVRIIVLILASLLAGVAVAFCGIIGFVGLIVPHMIRILVGPNHRVLLPASGMAGGIFLIWMNTIASTAMAPEQIPVGVVTAFCGAPFFMYLLRKGKHGW